MKKLQLPQALRIEGRLRQRQDWWNRNNWIHGIGSVFLSWLCKAKPKPSQSQAKAKPKPSQSKAKFWSAWGYVENEASQGEKAYNSEDAVPGAANANNNGGVGQFVIGTFTATAATETFTLSVPDGQGGLQLNAIQVRNTSAGGLLGDVNLDGVVDFFDIQPLIDLLSNQTFQFEGDIDGDGDVDFFDIQPFIDILAGMP